MPLYEVTLTATKTIRVEAKDANDLDDLLNQWDNRGFDGIEEAVDDAEWSFDFEADPLPPDREATLRQFGKPWKIDKYGTLARIERKR